MGLAASKSHPWSGYLEEKAKKPRGFTIQDAERLFMASGIAYKEDAKDEKGLEAALKNGMAEPGAEGTWPEMKKLEYLNDKEKTDTQAFVAVSLDGEQLVLACRGTTTINDWLHNITGAFTAFEPNIDGDTPGSFVEEKFGCMGSNSKSKKPGVHRGFYTAFLPLRAVINKFMVPLCKGESSKVKELSFVGHSLGGGLAVLSFVYMMLQCPDLHKNGIKVNVMTFGSPRVGNAKFRAFLRKQSLQLRKNKLLRNYRVHLDGDPVPCLPPRLMGFVHTGRVVRVVRNDDGKIAEMYFKGDGMDQDDVEASECTDLNGMWDKPSFMSEPIDSLVAHAPPSYEKTLKTCNSAINLVVDEPDQAKTGA